MKCTNCGKNTATCHYRSDINGKVTEQHLCSECAEKLYGKEDLFSGFDSMFDDFFTPFEGFFGRGRSLFSGLDRLMTPTLLMPRITLIQQGAENKAETEESTAEEKADPELARRREINALREQMKSAAEAEDYEKAAELRDKLHELEKTA